MTVLNSPRQLHDTTPAGPEARFCARCGVAPDLDADARVCEHCGLGVVLSAPADSVPEAGEAFLVVDSSLTVGAVSAAAEQALGITETRAVRRHVSELLSAPDAEGGSPGLASVLTWAARGDGSPRELTVRPTGTFGVRFQARVGRCGPPSAALLVLADA